MDQIQLAETNSRSTTPFSLSGNGVAPAYETTNEFDPCLCKQVRGEPLAIPGMDVVGWTLFESGIRTEEPIFCSSRALL
jgi:hypothetical protein